MEQLYRDVVLLIALSLGLLSVWHQIRKMRNSAEVRELADRYTVEAIGELARLGLKAKSERARIIAIRELLDRAIGTGGAADNGKTVHNAGKLVIMNFDE